MPVDPAIPKCAPPRTSLLRTWLPLVILLSPMILAVALEGLRAWFTPDPDAFPFDFDFQGILVLLTVFNASEWIWTGRMRPTRSLLELVVLAVLLPGVLAVQDRFFGYRTESQLQTSPILGLSIIGSFAFGIGILAWMTSFMLRWPRWGMNQLDRSGPITIADLFIFTTLVCLGFAASPMLEGAMNSVLRTHEESWTSVFDGPNQATIRYTSFDSEIRMVNPFSQVEFYGQTAILAVMVPPILAPVFLFARFCHFRLRRRGNWPIVLFAALVTAVLAVLAGPFHLGESFMANAAIGAFCVATSFVQYVLLFLCVDVEGVFSSAIVNFHEAGSDTGPTPPPVYRAP